MKKILILCLLFQPFLVANSQQLNINLSEGLKFDNYYNLEKCGDAFFSLNTFSWKLQLTYRLKKLKYGLSLSKYNKNMSLAKENPLSNGDKVFGPFPSSLQKINDKLYLLYCQLPSTTDTSSLQIMLAQIDTATLALQAPQVLFTIDRKTLQLFQDENEFSNVSLSLHQSPDKTKILISWSSCMNNEVFFSVFNENFNLLWKSKESLTSAGSRFLASCIDNQGEVVMSYKARASKDEFQGRLYICRHDQPPVDKEIKLGGGHPFELLLLPSSKEPFINVVGPYIGETELINGVYAAKISTGDFNISSVKQTAFSDAMIQQWSRVGLARTKKNNYGVVSLNMQAYELGDGSIGMAGMLDRKDSYDPRIVSYITGDIIVVHFGDKEAIIARVPKYKMGAGNVSIDYNKAFPGKTYIAGDCYYAFPCKDRTIVIYNDTEANLKKDMEDVPASSNGSNDLVLVAATINPDGTVKREKILEKESHDFLARTAVPLVLTPSSILLPLRRIKGSRNVPDNFKWAAIEVK